MCSYIARKDTKFVFSYFDLSKWSHLPPHASSLIWRSVKQSHRRFSVTHFRSLEFYAAFNDWPKLDDNKLETLTNPEKWFGTLKKNLSPEAKGTQDAECGYTVLWVLSVEIKRALDSAQMPHPKLDRMRFLGNWQVPSPWHQFKRIQLFGGISRLNSAWPILNKQVIIKSIATLGSLCCI